MRRFVMTIAAMAALGIVAPTVITQAQAQHVVVQQGGGHGGGYQRGHRANRPVIVNRGHGMDRQGMSSRPRMERHAPPRMHRRDY